MRSYPRMPHTSFVLSRTFRLTSPVGRYPLRACAARIASYPTPSCSHLLFLDRIIHRLARVARCGLNDVREAVRVRDDRLDLAALQADFVDLGSFCQD